MLVNISNINDGFCLQKSIIWRTILKNITFYIAMIRRITKYTLHFFCTISVHKKWKFRTLILRSTVSRFIIGLNFFSDEWVLSFTIPTASKAMQWCDKKSIDSVYLEKSILQWTILKLVLVFESSLSKRILRSGKSEFKAKLSNAAKFSENVGSILRTLLTFSFFIDGKWKTSLQ